MDRNFSLHPLEPGEHLELNNKTDPTMNDQAHNGEIDDEISLIPHEVVGKERVSAVIEGRNRVIECMIKSCPRRKIDTKPDKEKKSPGGFSDKRKPEDHFGNHDKISSRRVEKGRLDNLSPLKRESTTHEDKKNR